LIVVATSEGSDDWPVLLRKYHKHHLYLETVKAFLNIKKIVLIPRPPGDNKMCYCISNLLLYQHGALHLELEQAVWF
jgi:hypothetical protein